MKLISLFNLFLILISIKFAFAEPFVTVDKITKTLKRDQRIESLLPCSLANTETVCALIHTGNMLPNEFRVYAHENNQTPSIKVIFSFLPGRLGNAQNLLGSLSPTPPNNSLFTFWSLPGVHSEGKKVVIKVSLKKNGTYSAEVTQEKIAY